MKTLTPEQKATKALKHLEWARKNKDKRNAYRRELAKNNPIYRIKNIELLRKRRIETPWLSHYDCARTRCTNKKRKEYHRYGGRGILFLLAQEDVRQLWFRDKAYEMKRPTIDRIDNDGHYDISNCRFIEKSLNSTKGNYEAKWKR